MGIVSQTAGSLANFGSTRDFYLQVLDHGCGVHFPAPRLHSSRREFPYDGFIDFATMHAPDEGLSAILHCRFLAYRVLHMNENERSVVTEIPSYRHKLCQLHGLHMRELSRTDVSESVAVPRGLGRVVFLCYRPSVASSFCATVHRSRRLSVLPSIGRVVFLCYRSSTSCQIREGILYLCL